MTARKMGLQETLASELTERSIDNILQFRQNVARACEIRLSRISHGGWRYYKLQVERQIVLQLSLADWEITR